MREFPEKSPARFREAISVLVLPGGPNLLREFLVVLRAVFRDGIDAARGGFSLVLCVAHGSNFPVLVVTPRNGASLRVVHERAEARVKEAWNK
jgi:hypothetical protein